jgi:hypothetical protein
MSTGPRVVLCVEESSQIGFGHMSRCWAMADTLLKAKAQISFRGSKVRNGTRTSLKLVGLTVVDLMPEEAFLQQDWRDTVLLVDGYQFDDVCWKRLIAIRPRRSVCIDEFRSIRYSADILGSATTRALRLSRLHDPCRNTDDRKCRIRRHQ